MPDDAIERARNVAIAAQLSDAVIYNRDDAFRALAFKNRHLIVASLAAFASQQAPEGWSKVATLEEAASECSRIGTDTVFASDVTEDFKAGYQAAVNTCCASLALIARHAVPAAMLDAAPSVTLGEVG